MSAEARKEFDRELEALQEDLRKMGSVVEEMLDKAIEALKTRNVSLAQEVQDMDDIVDRYNLDIESRSLRLLALQQPMARDLRIIAAAMKIITDIERAGDYSVDIAKIAEKLADKPLFKPLEDIPKMVSIVQEMLRETLTAFITHDLNLIERMIAHDEEVDHLYNSLHEEIMDYIRKDTNILNQAIGLLFIARYLERIADHITNIGERIYYMETGELKELHQ